ncbi:protein of unknown function [Cardinium endosymbiont cEper1 of Encarsia pergandiella]|nr:protein of unknown function [Cardinium endosymbiont cEper1 of Encarsia pergandiella]
MLLASHFFVASIAQHRPSIEDVYPIFCLYLRATPYKINIVIATLYGVFY